jgi:SAM-dependent methyltransferase
LYTLPFPHDYFDKVFRFGVLQHTPDVALAFATIAKYVKPGGELTVDVYNKNYWRNYHTRDILSDQLLNDHDIEFDNATVFYMRGRRQLA